MGLICGVQGGAALEQTALVAVALQVEKVNWLKWLHGGAAGAAAVQQDQRMMKSRTTTRRMSSSTPIAHH